MDAEYIIEMRDICKSFYGVKILHDVNFKLRPGEIRGLLGENGAGKSTMMRILNGIYSKDSGKIFVNGEEAHFTLPKDARAAKIAFVHQEIALSANLTIAQNMFLGLEITRGKYFLDDAAMRQAALDALKSLGLDLNVDTVVGTLSIAQPFLSILLYLSVKPPFRWIARSVMASFSSSAVLTLSLIHI